MSLTTDIQLPLFPSPATQLVPKLLHAGDDWTGQPYVYVDENSVVVSGKAGHGVLTDKQFGTTITGPIALFESPENMHIGGGYWIINPVQLSCLASSSATPIPWLLRSTPRILASAVGVRKSVETLQAYDPTISSLI